MNTSVIVVAIFSQRCQSSIDIEEIRVLKLRQLRYFSDGSNISEVKMFQILGRQIIVPKFDSLENCVVRKQFAPQS